MFVPSWSWLEVNPWFLYKGEKIIFTPKKRWHLSRCHPFSGVCHLLTKGIRDYLFLFFSVITMFPSSKIIRKICLNGKATVPFPWSPQGGLGQRFPNSLSDDTSKNNMSFPSKNWYENYFCFCFVGGVILRFLSVVAKFQVLFPSIVFKCSIF